MRYPLFLTFTLLWINSHGQEMSFGLRSGVSFSNFYAHHSPGTIPDITLQPNSNDPPVIINPDHNSPPPSYYYETDLIDDLRAGFYTYAFLDRKLQKRLSAEVGLGYSQKGIQMKYRKQSTSLGSDNSATKLSYHFSRNLRLDYIVIPVALLYKVGKSERFYISAGLYNSFATSFLIRNSLIVVDEQEFDGSGQLQTRSQTQVIQEDAYAGLFDSGVTGGFGFAMPLTAKLSIGIDTRAAIGLVNIPKKYESNGFQSFSKTTKNINLETGLKLLFDLH